MSIIYEALKKTQEEPANQQETIDNLVLPEIPGKIQPQIQSLKKPRRNIFGLSLAIVIVISIFSLFILGKKTAGIFSDKPLKPIRKIMPAETPSQEKPFVLSGIIYSPDEPMAIINGEMVRLDDTIAGAQVSAISENSAELTLQDKKITLRLE